METWVVVMDGVVTIVEKQKIEHRPGEIATVVVLAVRVATVVLKHV